MILITTKIFLFRLLYSTNKVSVSSHGYFNVPFWLLLCDFQLVSISVSLFCDPIISHLVVYDVVMLAIITNKLLLTTHSEYYKNATVTTCYLVFIYGIERNEIKIYGYFHLFSNRNSDKLQKTVSLLCLPQCNINLCRWNLIN